MSHFCRAFPSCQEIRCIHETLNFFFKLSIAFGVKSKANAVIQRLLGQFEHENRGEKPNGLSSDPLEAMFTLCTLGEAAD